MRPPPPRHVLAVCPRFPALGEAADGMAEYVTRCGRALHEASGARLHVVAWALGDEPPLDEDGWRTIHRVPPACATDDVFELYRPDRFGPALRALHRALRPVRAALPPEATVAWCHGYETGDAARRLRATGLPVVAVSHYLLAHESVFDLAAASDPVRSPLLDSPTQRLLGRLLPPRARAPFVGAVARAAPLAHALPGGHLRARVSRLGLERRLLTAAHVTVAVGREHMRTLAALYPRSAGRLHWCHAGIAPVPRDVRGFPGDGRPAALRVLMAARPAPQKGWEYGVAALHELERGWPEVADGVHVVTIGGLRADGGAYERGVLARFADLSRVRVDHLGHVPRARAQTLLADADTFLFPSLFEPFGLALAEAMAAGCEIIASDADGPRDLVRPPWGRTIPFADPRRAVAGMAAALAEAAGRGPEERRALAEGARAAAATLSWATCAREHLHAMARARTAAGSERGG